MNALDHGQLLTIRREAAIQRLVATAEIVRDSMSVTEQRALFSRLTSDIAAVRFYDEPTQVAA